MGCARQSLARKRARLVEKQHESRAAAAGVGCVDHVAKLGSVPLTLQFRRGSVPEILELFTPSPLLPSVTVHSPTIRELFTPAPLSPSVTIPTPVFDTTVQPSRIVVSVSMPT